MAVLEQLVAEAGRRAAALPTGRQTSVPRQHRSFRDAIAGRDRIDCIAEFKRCSPSQGPIRPHASVVQQVVAYARGGASALSVLTEPTRFRGQDLDLQLAAAAVSLPILMKDFIVSPRQIEHAATLGAAAVLLIVRCLPGPRLTELAQVCVGFGLTPLIECHDEDEIRRALAFDDAVIGINQRDLGAMTVDPTRGRRLLQAVPGDRVVVVESGIEAPAAVQELAGHADAVLIGTALMRAADPRRFLVDALRRTVS